MASSQARLPNVKGLLWVRTCGQKLEHCYLLETVTVPLSLEIPSCTLADMEPSKLYNLELQSFIIFENLFSNFERWTPSETGFVKENLDATLTDYKRYPGSFVVGANFCS